ncbi:cytochrome c-type biogenesis protein [Novosphingobium sp.]|uniref:cytochrome c-type biogenesis protein n=1 Tax=Novosphingobium sp. TaxID=1874826 RepID=UPI0025E15295|nr:cytochrome c-type biogenesis protein [Novosphingobium sp.]
MIRLLFAATLLLVAVPTTAQDKLPPAPYAYRQLDDPQQEDSAKALMDTLRCLQCQGQAISDSDAPIAGDMRNQVRLRIAQGESPEAIRAWLVERYGSYVSYKPHIGLQTWPLFVAPAAFVALAALVLRKRFGKGDSA